MHNGQRAVSPLCISGAGLFCGICRQKKGLYKPLAMGYNARQGMKFSLGKPKPLFQKLMTSVIERVAEAVGFFCVPKEEL